MKKLNETTLTYFKRTFDMGAPAPILTTNMVRQVGNYLDVDFNKIAPSEYYQGLQTEKENTKDGPEDSKLTMKDWVKYGAIAWKNLTKDPTFYHTVDTSESLNRLKEFIRTEILGALQEAKNYKNAKPIKNIKDVEEGQSVIFPDNSKGQFDKIKGNKVIILVQNKFGYTIPHEISKNKFLKTVRITEARVYLKKGEKPPKGAKAIKGKRGGQYYETGKGKSSKKPEWQNPKFVSWAKGQGLDPAHGDNLKRWKDTENYRQSRPDSNYANLAKKPNGPNPISKMGEEDPKFTKAQGQGVKLNQLLRTKFGSGNIELEETKVVGDQIQQWFGIEDEAVKRSKKLNVSPTSEALLKGILADIKKMDLPSGYKPVIRQIQNTHSGRVVQGGGMFLILVKDVKEDDFEDSIPDSYKSLATQPNRLTSANSFDAFLNNIDKMPESEIKKIMGDDYIDTPGDYNADQMMRAGRNISRYYRDNMGNNKYEKLKKWYTDNKKGDT